MGKALYFECNSGISGDMTLGALIDLGADIDIIREELSKLDIHGEYVLTSKDAKKSGISGIDFDVVIKDTGHKKHNHKSNDKKERSSKSEDEYVLHDYDYVPDNKVEQDHDHNHSSFSSIKEMIEKSTLNGNVKKMSIDIFTVIAKAEAAVHKMELDKVVFHEVGAVDSIIDIVGTAIAIDFLDIEEVYCTQVHDGSGFIECRHGTIPVPVPAVMEMIQGSDIPIIIDENIETEMVTPTGFGILEGLKAQFKSKLEIKVDKVGYGFGNRETGLFNAVRIIMGEVQN